MRRPQQPRDVRPAGSSALGDQISGAEAWMTRRPETTTRAARRRETTAAAMRTARERIVPALLTIEEAAVYLAIPLETAKYKIYRTCEIPSVRLPGKGERRSRRVRRVDLDALIEKGRIPAFDQYRQQGLPIRTREIEEERGEWSTIPPMTSWRRATRRCARSVWDGV